MTGVATSKAHSNNSTLGESLWEFVVHTKIEDPNVYELAWHTLLQGLNNVFSALKQPEIQRTLGPLESGGTLSGGARVIGTAYELSLPRAAHNLALLFTGAKSRQQPQELGMPWDTWGALLAVADGVDRPKTTDAEIYNPLTVHDLLTACIKSCSIQSQLMEHEICTPTEAMVISTSVTSSFLMGEGFPSGALGTFLSGNNHDSSALQMPEDIAAANELGVALATESETEAKNQTQPDAFFQQTQLFSWQVNLPMLTRQDPKQTIETLYKLMLDFISPTVCEALKTQFAKPKEVHKLAVHDFMAHLVSSLS